MTRALKELRVVAHVVDTGEYLLEVTKPELLLFEVKNDVQIILICKVLIAFV